MAFFSIPTKKKEERELRSVEDLHRLFSSEVTLLQEFDQALRSELSEIGHLEHNIALVTSQMDSVRKLATTKRDIHHRLLEEIGKRDSEVDTNQVQQYVQMIQQVDSQLMPLLQRMNQEVMRLQVSETHELYKESDQARKVMREVDDKARKISAELVVIQRSIEAFGQDMNAIMQQTQKIITERDARPGAKGHMGFKTS